MRDTRVKLERWYPVLASPALERANAVPPALSEVDDDDDAAPHDEREILGESLDMAPLAAPTAALSIDVIPPVRVVCGEGEPGVSPLLLRIMDSRRDQSIEERTRVRVAEKEHALVQHVARRVVRAPHTRTHFTNRPFRVSF